MSIKNQDVVVYYYAEDTSTGQGKTGDEANHTLRVAEAGVVSTIDGGPVAQEVDATYFPGFYYITVPGSDNGADTQLLGGTSSTADVEIRPVVWTNDLYSPSDLSSEIADLQASVDSIISIIQGSTITAVSSANIESGRLTLVRGDSYDNVLNPKVTFTFESSVNVVGVTAVITARDVDDDTVKMTNSGGVVTLVSGSTYLATFTLSATDTSTLPVGVNAAKFDIQLVSGSSKRTVVTGKIIVIEDQTRT